MGSPPTSLVTYSPHGETVIEWWFGTRKLTVWTSSSKRGEGLRVWGPDMQTEMEWFDASDPESFKVAWRWLTGVSGGADLERAATAVRGTCDRLEIQWTTLRIGKKRLPPPPEDT